CLPDAPGPPGVCPLSLHDALPILAGEANALEARGELWAARDAWLSAAPLLPAASAQGKWVRERIRTLQDAATALEGREKKKRWADRKSTRLNSSHVKISYAVFCLK